MYSPRGFRQRQPRSRRFVTKKRRDPAGPRFANGRGYACRWSAGPPVSYATLRVFDGGVGYSKPRGAATPHAAPRGLYSTNDRPAGLVRLAPLHRRDRSCGSARRRAVGHFCKAEIGPLQDVRRTEAAEVLFTRRSRRPQRPTCVSVVGLGVGARRAIGPWGEALDRARAPPARSRQCRSRAA